MTLKDETGLDTVPPSRNRISLDVGSPSPRSIQLEEQISPADEYAPKIRKPYTITKQRERWSEEEHRKFLEALQLHGRAWRRIEEHVGTKTAVQIRSHAQKFFTKVVRESINGDTTSVKSIEIPPPRPKRKPLHPYPRKLAAPVKKGTVSPVKSKRSVSPDNSLTEQENQSPTSVLSTLGSDAFGTADSHKLSESLSPVSSAVAEKSHDLVLSEPSDFMPEETRSSPAQSHALDPDNLACMKLELFPQDKDLMEEASSTQCLRLFGKTVLVTDEPAPEVLAQSSITRKISPRDTGCAPSTLTIAPTTPFFYMPASNGGSRINGTISSPLLPWGSYNMCASPCTQVHSPIPVRGRPRLREKEWDDKDAQKEGSSTGSNTESVSADLTGEKSLEAEAHSSQNQVEEAGRELSSGGARVPSWLERRAKSTKRLKGFVPYKRCLSERSISSSTLTGEEREEQRTRLCL